MARSQHAVLRPRRVARHQPIFLALRNLKKIPQVERVVGRLICAIRGGDRGLDIVKRGVAGEPEQAPDISTLPLYGPSGAPTIQDVNQGYLGDCYFLSSLGEVALQDPSAIENMIASNGNGTYSVRFYVNGKPDYATVNSQLPVMGGGYEWANGSQLEFANGTTDDWYVSATSTGQELC